MTNRHYGTFYFYQQTDMSTPYPKKRDLFRDRFPGCCTITKAVPIWVDLHNLAQVKQTRAQSYEFRCFLRHFSACHLFLIPPIKCWSNLRDLNLYQSLIFVMFHLSFLPLAKPTRLMCGLWVQGGGRHIQENTYFHDKIQRFFDIEEVPGF